MIYDMMILAIPKGKFNPHKHGNAFTPFESSPDVWVIQVRLSDNLNEWVSIPVIRDTEAIKGENHA